MNPFVIYLCKLWLTYMSTFIEQPLDYNIIRFVKRKYILSPSENAVAVYSKKIQSTIIGFPKLLIQSIYNDH